MPAVAHVIRIRADDGHTYVWKFPHDVCLGDLGQTINDMTMDQELPFNSGNAEVVFHIIDGLIERGVLECSSRF